MRTNVLVIARKEITDALRDVRPLISSIFYCLMGPGVVLMVSVALSGKDSGSVLTGMMSIFLIVSAFSGGMNVAMDILAGERERQSLLPLLLNGVSRREVMLGKWLAVSAFSVASVLLNLAAFVFVLGRGQTSRPPEIASVLPIIVAGLIPLGLFAAAVELGLSTICRTVKEAHTYLSMLVFLPTGLGFLTVFFPKIAEGWGRLVPLIGQQWQVEHWWRAGEVSLVQVLVTSVVTLAFVAAALKTSASLLERDDVVYGG